MIIEVGSFSYKDQEMVSYIEEEKKGGNLISFDVRYLPEPITETRGEVSNNGESEAVERFMLSRVEVIKFLIFHKDQLEKQILILKEIFKEQEKKELKIYYGCEGGIQRSVFIAKTIYNWLKVKFPDCQIRKTHTSSHMQTKMLLINLEKK